MSVEDGDDSDSNLALPEELQEEIKRSSTYRGAHRGASDPPLPGPPGPLNPVF